MYVMCFYAVLSPICVSAVYISVSMHVHVY